MLNRLLGGFTIEDREVCDEEGHFLYNISGADKEKELVDRGLAVYIDPDTGEAVNPEARRLIEGIEQEKRRAA